MLRLPLLVSSIVHSSGETIGTVESSAVESKLGVKGKRARKKARKAFQWVKR